MVTSTSEAGGGSSSSELEELAVSHSLTSAGPGGTSSFSVWPDATASSISTSPVSEGTGVVRTESITSLRMELIIEVGRLLAASITSSSTGTSGDCETFGTRGDTNVSTAGWNSATATAGTKGISGSNSILSFAAAVSSTSPTGSNSVRLHSSSLRGGLRRWARNQSVSPSGSSDPWAAALMVGSLVGAGDPGAAHGSGDPEGLTDRSNKICSGDK
ncbi:hypothetical protein Taro_037942 [Colocasia esculenta]|uniref:Uncharacterized protein n=1 Tax=Colocasia esculenta TaxID=4460 RepID=A0A843WR80_COLES|nr:hypothetical protein [Colocasia esculenta]